MSNINIYFQFQIIGSAMVAGVRVVVVVSCAVVAAMAYALYVPLPDGFVQPWKTRVVLTVTELAISMVREPMT